MPLLFPRKQEVLEIHARLIEAFGGSYGLRDEGALESALTAAENREHYENADLTTCAATYAYHLSQARAFMDGNKRVAAVSGWRGSLSLKAHACTSSTSLTYSRTAQHPQEFWKSTKV